MDELKTALHCMKVLAEIEVCEECSEYENCDHTKQSDIARTCISALEKHIPKKPEANIENGKVKEAKCPSCGYDFPDIGGLGECYFEVEQYDFCPNCGQAIDWNTED